MTTGNDLVCVCGTFVPKRIKFFDFPQQVTMLSMYEENAGEQVVASSFYEENAGVTASDSRLCLTKLWNLMGSRD